MARTSQGTGPGVSSGYVFPSGTSSTPAVKPGTPLVTPNVRQVYRGYAPPPKSKVITNATDV